MLVPAPSVVLLLLATVVDVDAAVVLVPPGVVVVPVELVVPALSTRRDGPGAAVPDDEAGVELPTTAPEEFGGAMVATPTTVVAPASVVPVPETVLLVAPATDVAVGDGE